MLPPLEVCHIVSSTQAGGSYGWSLLLLSLSWPMFLSHPFFRFGAEYTADTGRHLVEGYAEKGKIYLWIFFDPPMFSLPWSTQLESLSFCSAIIASAFPMIGLSILSDFQSLFWSFGPMLLFGQTQTIKDGMWQKWIMSALTITFVLADYHCNN